MKKFISGFVVGALLFGGVSAFAASGLIGQKVQGLYSIEKAGVKVADAVIIDGSAYAPVRAVAAATGTGLTVEGKKIIMQDVSTAQAPAATPAQGSTKTLAEFQIERNKVSAEIDQRQTNIIDLESSLIPTFEAQAKELSGNGKLGEMAQKTADEYKAVVVKQKAEIVTLQQQLTDIDARIAALQK
ncbi:hypothetical protein P40081_15395 [Paenibacillus sp. FSL P4-0081]|uniref:hypothetical protein n=1 Tax=Paenibacillus sp. FSL P4-0081 TaxID=1536769 RepID=UPI0004F704DB|nr:hypothetical protein [Paenibacillus sp. FSL P4-0081]AIQ29379.1 hypothetical protein P40081_15395 [Paenibacillus sp. FSL P4-0081]